MIDLVFKNYTSEKAPGQGFFKKILETSVEVLKLKKELEVSVNLVGLIKMRAFNNKYRNKDKPTDVLSFPLGNGSGDIFICLSIAKKEAKRENVDIDKKLAQLVVHGFLHLLGYDHEKSKADAKIMLDLEVGILNKLNFY